MGLIRTKETVTHGVLVLIFFSFLYTIFFSPVIFSSGLLAPGDGIIQSVPAFYSPRTLWTPLLLSGFPAAADPTTQSWYPVSVAFSLIPHSWNAFVISAYVLASCFSYGYMYTLTRSRLAASFSGIAYGMSGFMMAHLGHTSMIHTAAWLPLILWSLEKLRYQLSASWIVAGIIAIACSSLAGHPQIVVYILTLSILYAVILGSETSVKFWQYYLICALIIVLGLCLSAIQLVPTFELSKLTLRSDISFEQFLSYSLPVKQVAQLLFPYLFGGAPQTIYQPVYFGEWGLAEITGYSGLLPLMLALIGCFTHQPKKLVWFWISIGLLALLISLGDATPIAKLIYHVPIYNKFRALARHFFEMSFAVSVLAGFGAAAIIQKTASFRLVQRAVFFVIGLVIAGIFSLLLISRNSSINLNLLNNVSLSIPITILILAASSLIFWSVIPRSRLAMPLILFILIIDLSSFGWFINGPQTQPYFPSVAWLKPTTVIEKYKEVLGEKSQRILPLRGGIGAQDEIPANMSRLWGVPSASAYGPLMFSRTNQLLSMGSPGDVPSNAGALLEDENRAMDIMAIRFISSPQLLPQSFQGSLNGQIPWSESDLSLSLGQDCLPNKATTARIELPVVIEDVSSIGIVSSLGCSTNLGNRTELARLSMNDSSGNITTQSLYAGSDTAEWAYDCPDVLPAIKHQRAKIWSTFSASNQCQGHKYVSTLQLDKDTNIKNIKFEWLAPAGAISIHKITLASNVNKKVYPITQTASSKRWKLVENVSGISFYENTQVLPRVWLAPEVISMKSDEILQAIHTSQLPGGRAFNPSLTALVEEPYELKPKGSSPEDTAKIEKLTDTEIEIKTSSIAPSFLVLSDTYYPGWQAFVDGQPTKIFQTDYVLRGVEVPAGEHTVIFRYRPTSFHMGLGLSVASTLLLVTLYFQPRLKYLEA